MPKRSQFYDLVMKKPNELMQWYAKTTPERRKNIYLSLLIRYLWKPLAFIAVCAVGYELMHTDVNPITGRSCIYSVPIGLADEIESDLFKEIFMSNMKTGSFIPASDPYVKRLDRCVDRIVSGNKDQELIGAGIWTPVVINDDQICDIIVLKESRNIFVYKKMLDLCETDDELAYVLAHQLSHVMLDHRREPTAYTSMLYVPLIPVLTQLWNLSTDNFLKLDIFNKIDSFFENAIKEIVRKAILFSSYSEELEEEADRIAMQVMTRSCYDIRKCRHFCKKYKHLSPTSVESEKSDSKTKTSDNTNESNFFSKHPISEQKLLYLFQYIKPFLEIRKECNCQPLVD